MIENQLTLWEWVPTTETLIGMLQRHPTFVSAEYPEAAAGALQWLYPGFHFNLKDIEHAISIFVKHSSRVHPR